MANKYGSFQKILAPLRKSYSVILFLILWEVGCKTGLINQNFVAAPSVIIKTFWELAADGRIWSHIMVSLQRTVVGFMLAIIIGIPLGVFLGGGFKTFERLVRPVLYFWGQFNPFSLFPVFMLLLGIGEMSKIAMIFWVSLWPILFNTITGVKEVDPLLLKASRSMGASRLLLFVRVVFPSALPYIFTGIKMSSNIAFFMLIAAEMIGASRGLGWLIWNAQTNYQIPVLYAATVTISLLGLIIGAIFKSLEKKFVNWKDAVSL